MGFTEDIAKVSEQVRKNADHVVGEQATKMALIVPFFSALGYDVFDPTEVMPEYIADFATKGKGPLKKVDYAIAINGTIVMLVEAKARGEKAETHDGQIRYYFNGLVATKVGVVTNGIEYRFFTDLRDKNVMDEEPFFSFNILEYDSKDLENLKFFHRDNFDTSAISRKAEDMVYVKGMTQLIGSFLRSPSKEFMRFLLKELGKELGEVSPLYKIEGQINDKRINRFEPIIKKSIQISLVELMTRSLTQEMGQPLEEEKVTKPDEIEEIEEEVGQISDGSKVETTAEELEAFEKIKAIAATSKVFRLEVKYKDVAAYFGVHVGNSTWWFLRLYLTQTKKSFITRLSVNEVKSLAPDFDVKELSAPLGGATSRVIISSVSDLDKLAPLILKCYETEAAKH
jgi:hypothetical protein